MIGLSKSEFFIQSCMYQAILVKGNIKTFSEIKMKLGEISAALDKNPRLEELEHDQVESFKTILQILNVMF